MAYDYNNVLEGGKNLPQHCLAFPKTRYYFRQILLNPNRAVKNVLHKLCGFSNPAYKDRDIEALKSKASKKTGFSEKVYYNKDRFLARGAYGNVYLSKCFVKDKNGYLVKQLCALKVLNRTCDQDHDAIQKEADLLKKLKEHPFIVKYIFSGYHDKSL